MTCINLKTIFVDAQRFEVPCGKCIPCLGNKRSDWSFRLEQEFKYSKGALFVTLTYDEKHRPSNGSLCKRHLQLFMKRLRKADGTNKIRYYAVGEYGGKSGRPHYHILLFNVTDESIVRKSWFDKKGRPVGIVHIGRVTPASVAYVTKYIVQPQEEVDGLEKPFSLMSRAYGIGARYLSDEMVQWHQSNGYNYVVRPGNEKSRLPRFYRDKIWPNVSLRSKKKVTRATMNSWKVVKYRRDLVRKAVSSAAMELVLENQRREDNVYKKMFGERWERAKLDARNAFLSRVKTKVAYTQRL